MIAHFHGSSSTAPSTSATNYNALLATGSASWNATEIARHMVVPHALTLDMLRVIVTTAPGGAASWTVTIMKNGVATALTCTISGSSTSAQDLTHSVSFAAGDLISIQWTPASTPAASGTVYWTCRQSATNLFSLQGMVLTTAASTIFCPPMNRAASSSTDALGQVVIPTAGTLKNLTFYTNSAPGASASWAVTVIKNGSASTLTCTLSGASAVLASDTADTVSVAAGDTISIQIAPTGSPTLNIAAFALSFSPTNDGESFICYSGNGQSPSTSVTSFQEPIGADTVWNATETNVQMIMQATTLKAIYAATSVSPGISPKAYAFTARNNAADTAAAVTINDASTVNGSGRWGSTAGQSITVNDDDKFAIKSIPTSTPSSLFAKTSLLLYIAPASSAPLVSQWYRAASQPVGNYYKTAVTDY